MIKHVHLLFAALAIAGLVARVVAAEIKPSLLAEKWVKITPHVISAILLLSGVVLVFVGGWLSSDYGWIVAKVLALPVFIGLGIASLRMRGTQRWLAFAGALLCFIYIAKVAVSKQAFFFI
ncbi:MAG: SirB2 family protein [Gammaproteobacteria bacterium]